jgi:hypothetical protein
MANDWEGRARARGGSGVPARHSSPSTETARWTVRFRLRNKPSESRHAEEQATAGRELPAARPMAIPFAAQVVERDDGGFQTGIAEDAPGPFRRARALKPSRGRRW